MDVQKRSTQLSSSNSMDVQNLYQNKGKQQNQKFKKTTQSSSSNSRDVQKRSSNKTPKNNNTPAQAQAQENGQQKSLDLKLLQKKLNVLSLDKNN